MNAKLRTSEQIIADYEKKSSILLKKLLNLMLRAQEKVDNIAYRKALENVKKLKK